MDVRGHARARSAREHLLSVKEKQRMASIAKTDCEGRIRLLMEELKNKQEEQVSLQEDMTSSAKKAKYLEAQIKRRDTALTEKKPGRGTHMHNSMCFALLVQCSPLVRDTLSTDVRSFKMQGQFLACPNQNQLYSG